MIHSEFLTNAADCSNHGTSGFYMGLGKELSSFVNPFRRRRMNLIKQLKLSYLQSFF